MDREYWESDLRTTSVLEGAPTRAVSPTLQERWAIAFERWKLVLFFLTASLFFEVGYFVCWSTHTCEVRPHVVEFRPESLGCER